MFSSVSAANTQGEQKSCGPIRNKVCCLGGVSIPPLFKGAWQRYCVCVERMDFWVEVERGGRKEE